MHANSILLVVTEEFHGNPAQTFCNIPWQWIIAHNVGLKYICGVKKFFKQIYIRNQKSSSVTTCRVLLSSCMWFSIDIEQVIMLKIIAGKSDFYIQYGCNSGGGEETPLKFEKYFQSIFLTWLTHKKTFKHSKIRNGEKRSPTYVFPLKWSENQDHACQAREQY